MGTRLFDAVIHPHRSLRTNEFCALFYFVLLANLAVAAFLIAVGGWPVLGFLGLDILGFYIAFRTSYFQARAFERVTVDREALIVERVDANGARAEWRFASYWVSVWFEGDDERNSVTLRSHGRSLAIGAFLSPFQRKDFADALRAALRDAKALPAPA